MFENEDFDFENRIITTSYTREDSDTDTSLRPKSLDDYIGQEKVKENLKIYIEAAKMRNESLDHVLLYGPPGLGKTTLSNIIAAEMGVNIRVTSGPAIEKQGDLAALLTNLSEGDVLFIDEIHRLSRSVEEIQFISSTLTHHTSLPGKQFHQNEEQQDTAVATGRNTRQHRTYAWYAGTELPRQYDKKCRAAR